MTEATALAYYDAIDADDYDALASLLAPGVVHDRPDRTIEGRETLVGFMRDGRPNKRTSHEVTTVFAEGEDGERVAVEGRLFDSGGEKMFGFVDAFAFEDGKIAEIRTYTD
ncbi:nuclear transport factor 2 family protein [Halorussus amylolyticus]|uniref:nuclear transport factor 2 family protein n=1 Tax=Halorussus amylolyticus TaxID=1126242 RepID=UPI00104490AA|nr:nuclear transport factor 2 family protein [Halorussus amylolyticus]